MNFDVVITCSGLGTRLAPLTNYLNKAMIKLGDQPSISHIINSYPEKTRFIITLGHLGEQVQDYLSIVYPEKDIKYVWVDKYDGEGSSLLYSLSKTFDIIDKPFIFNACDTIVKNISLDLCDGNYAFATGAMFDNQYRYYGDTIQDRPADLGEDCYVGLCYINDFEEFKSISSQLLKHNSPSFSDAHVLEKMNVRKMRIPEESWVDIGNRASLEKAKHKFGHKIIVLDKENEETYYDQNKIIKYFSDKEKVQKLYKRYIELKDCAPETYYINNFLYYDFIDGDTLSKVLNNNNFENFLDWCESHLWIERLEQIRDLSFYEDFYKKKAKERVKKYLNRFPGSNNVKSINFRKTDDIYDLFNKIDCIDLHAKINCIYCRTHGDLVFENVIQNDSYTMIDWREEFSNKRHFGDLYYDLAKMKHNLIFNHEVINNKQFIVNEEEDRVIFDPGIPSKNYGLIKIMDEWCIKNNYDLETINFKVALIQLSSSGLHLHEDAKLLFYMGWYNLQKIVNKYEQTS